MTKRSQANFNNEVSGIHTLGGSSNVEYLVRATVLASHTNAKLRATDFGRLQSTLRWRVR